MKDVIIIGTGGHAKVIADIVLCSGDNLVGFLTSDCDKDTFIEKPILKDDKVYTEYKDCYFIIAIGDPNARERISNSMAGVKWYTAIHPSSIISAINTSVGEGTAVMANAVINPFAKIGNHCIINTHSTVEHDNVIEDFSHISVGAKLAGDVKIGKGTSVGIGATVSNGISICEDCIIGAGAVVVKSIEASGTYVGVPAKKIK
ncbi:MAG: acetyltransferase [Ruminococcaceae bacterium]|nr:acetyltransferase [Oscillospiraceae bacterium]